MKKQDALDRWKSLSERQDPLPHFRPIPYKSTGSSYGACGIRIDGSPEFIDAVLSNLKSLIAGENQLTRLELARSEIKPTMGKTWAKAAPGAEVCYIRCHERGAEGQITAAVFDTHLAEATEEAAKAWELTTVNT